MTTLTLEMPDEVRAVIDEARGEQDVAAFLLTVGERAARRRVANRRPAPADSGVSEAEYHRQRAAEAEADGRPLDEVRQRLNAYMDASMAGEAARQ